MSARNRQDAQQRRDQVSAMWERRRARWGTYTAALENMGWTKIGLCRWVSRDRVWSIVGPNGDDRSYWLYRDHVRVEGVATRTPGDAMAKAWELVR